MSRKRVTHRLLSGAVLIFCGENEHADVGRFRLLGETVLNLAPTL